MAQAIWHLPRLRSHAEALKKYEDTPPIRGKGERRPLGRRRDHNSFWMRKQDDGSIDCMVYQTPVVSFRANGSVVLNNGGYVSNTTHGTISQMLYPLGVSAGGYRGRTKLTVSGDIYLMDAGSELQLAFGEDGKLHLPQKQQLISYSMDRKKANTVRRRYKEFTDYFLGMVKLRSEHITENHWGGAEDTLRITVPMQEIADGLGLMQDEGGSYMKQRVIFSHLGQGYGRNWYRAAAAKYRPMQERVFLTLIDPNQPQEGKMQSYYQAALALIIGDAVPIFRDNWEKDMPQISRYTANVVEFYDTALMMANAKEVLTLTKLAPGKMPNPRYRGWIEGEVDILKGEME